jgi:hypothetical protein
MIGSLMESHGIVPKHLFLGFLSLKLDKVMPGTNGTSLTLTRSECLG